MDRQSGGRALVERARAFMLVIHEGHKRRGANGTPWSEHLEETASLVNASGGDSVCVAAALLHDAVEYRKATPDEIRSITNDEVARLVERLTEPDDVRELPIGKKKAWQAKHLLTLGEREKRIKLADLISNVTSIVTDTPLGWDKEMCIEYIEGSFEVAEACRSVSRGLGLLFDDAYLQAMLKHS